MKNPPVPPGESASPSFASNPSRFAGLEPVSGVPDHLKQVFRRLALRGNPHWVSYYSKDGTPGKNDEQASVGHVTNGGVDLRHRAGRPYFYSQEVIDRHRLGFGFWSRSDRGEDGAYPFACYDIEPIQSGRVDREPDDARCRATAREAVRAFDAWTRLARRRPEILWVLLVESSPHHYHLWALFDRPLTRPEHHALVGEARALHGPLENLDKDTTRGGKRFGDQFRSPWSWKKGRRSETVASWLRDEARAVGLAEAAKPPGCRGVRRPEKPKQESYEPDALLEYAIARHPIAKHLAGHKGERDVKTAHVVADLVNRKIPEEVIREVCESWLEHFVGSYDATLDQAREHCNRVVTRTLSNPKFSEAEAVVDYDSLLRDTELSPLQRELLGRTGENNAPPGPSCVRGEKRVSPHESLAGEAAGPDRRLFSLPLRGRENNLLDLAMEAVLVLCQVELSKKGARPWRASFTHRQVFEVMKARHPEFWPGGLNEGELRTLDVQFRRMKKTFASYRLAPANGQEGKWHEATRVELLREVSKGTPGVASQYEVVGPLRDLLVAGGRVGPGGLSSASSATPTGETPERNQP